MESMKVCQSLEIIRRYCIRDFRGNKQCEEWKNCSIVWAGTLEYTIQSSISPGY